MGEALLTARPGEIGEPGPVLGEIGEPGPEPGEIGEPGPEPRPCSESRPRPPPPRGCHTRDLCLLRGQVSLIFRAPVSSLSDGMIFLAMSPSQGCWAGPGRQETRQDFMKPRSPVRISDDQVGSSLWRIGTSKDSPVLFTPASAELGTVVAG